MKKIIFLFSLSLIIVHIGLNIYNIYCYEEQKEEFILFYYFL